MALRCSRPSTARSTNLKAQEAEMDKEARKSPASPAPSAADR